MTADILIIGGGTAGMTAAVYARRAGKSVLLLEQEGVGGQITTSPNVENYPGIQHISGIDFAEALYNQTTALGAEISFEKAESLVRAEKGFEVKTDSGSHTAKAVILATGAKSRKLGLPGEEEMTGKGVSYCAVCDGAFFKGKPVAVIGGGSTALQDALYLASYCPKVYLIHRRNEFRGEDRTVEALRAKPEIELVLSSVPEELIYDAKITGLKVKNTVTSEVRALALDGIFIAVGQVPQNEAFSDLVKLDSYGYIVAGEDCITSEKGIFAAGDCRTKEVRQLTTAAADGAVSALAACKYTDEN